MLRCFEQAIVWTSNPGSFSKTEPRTKLTPIKKDWKPTNQVRPNIRRMNYLVVGQLVVVVFLRSKMRIFIQRPKIHNTAFYLLSTKNEWMTTSTLKYAETWGYYAPLINSGFVLIEMFSTVRHVSNYSQKWWFSLKNSFASGKIYSGQF